MRKDLRHLHEEILRLRDEMLKQLSAGYYEPIPELLEQQTKLVNELVKRSQE